MLQKEIKNTSAYRVKKSGRYCVKKLLLYNRMEAFIENFDKKWKNVS